jgi:hypothetical protein
MRMKALAAHLDDSFVILLLILLFLVAEMGVFAPSLSYATNFSSGYGTEELTDLSSHNDSGSSNYAVTTNTTMALLSNSSSIVHETEVFIAPPYCQNFCTLYGK